MIFVTAKAVRDTGSFLHRVECGILNWVMSMFLLYLYSIRYLAFMRLFLLFCWCYLAILMSRRYKCLALISLYCLLFSNRLPVDLLSGVILSFIDVIFLWLENGLIIAKSGNPNVMSRSILACFVLLVSAKLSPWLVTFESRWLASFLWPESGPCLAEDFRTGNHYGHYGKSVLSDERVQYI